MDAMTFADVSCPSACHEGVWGNGGIATLIIKLGRRWSEYSASPYSCYTVREISYIEQGVVWAGDERSVPCHCWESNHVVSSAEFRS